MNTNRYENRAAKATCCVWCGLLGIAAVTTHGQTALTVASLPGYPGGTVNLPVSVRRTTNMAAAQFDVAYNTGKVTAGELVAGGLFSNHVVRTREIAPGVVRVLAFSRANATVTVTNTQTAVEIPFTVSPTEYIGSGPIVVSNARLARPDAAPVAPLALNSGAIFVRSVNPQPEGAQLFLSSEAGVNYVVEATTNFVEWTDVSTNTAFGGYLDAFDPFATNSPYRFYRLRREP
jgi:hypothetical protein